MDYSNIIQIQQKAETLLLEQEQCAIFDSKPPAKESAVKEKKKKDEGNQVKLSKGQKKRQKEKEKRVSAMNQAKYLSGEVMWHNTPNADAKAFEDK